jgi:hypothetical protein
MRTKGISRKGVSEAFCQREREVSQFILESRLLQAQGHFDEATRRYAEAARLEEVQCEELERLGLHEKYWVHYFSALSCWGQAGNLFRAMEMAEALLARPNLPERYRERVREYRDQLRARQAEWLVAQREREAAEAAAA